MTKIRLDKLVQDLHPDLSRSIVQSLIIRGKVSVENRIETKPGLLISPAKRIVVNMAQRKYVSRGGEKLEPVFEERWIDVKDFICLDIGASTGGFTDSLLQHGAAKVYAVDVGHGQLDQKLRLDPRVIVMEKVNIRDLAILPEQVDLITIDVSFISLRLVLPLCHRFLIPEGSIIALCKPQFEADRATVSQGKGVIKDSNTRGKILAEFCSWLVQHSFFIINEATSPLAGPKGNLEHLFHLKEQV